MWYAGCCQLSISWWKLKVIEWSNEIERWFGEIKAIKWNSLGFNGILENK